mmetsp:Transcript_56889/g.151881  ORF Transcript_56889/g.151881 Transcript_56889/m.151881 type:complete len:135 (+) Transcript_56889:591-995(+)
MTLKSIRAVGAWELPQPARCFLRVWIWKKRLIGWMFTSFLRRLCELACVLLVLLCGANCTAETLRCSTSTKLEGCPLSILGMLLLQAMWHKCLSIRCPLSVVSASFVDDTTLRSPDLQQLDGEHFQILLDEDLR